MKRFALLFIAVLLISASALSETNDVALVLSEDTKKLADEFSKEISIDEGITLSVETLHFLGGKSAQSYAKQRAESIGENSAVLLIVVGEDDYVFYSKNERVFNRQIIDTLLANTFRPLFMQRQYDAAVYSFLEKLGQNMENKDRYARLFSQAEPAVIKENVEFEEPSYYEDYNIPSYSGRSDFGTSDYKLWDIIWPAFLIYIIFIRKNKRTNQRGCGCGCGPIGYIIGLLGLGRFFSKKYR